MRAYTGIWNYADDTFYSNSESVTNSSIIGEMYLLFELVIEAYEGYEEDVATLCDELQIGNAMPDLHQMQRIIDTHQRKPLVIRRKFYNDYMWLVKVFEHIHENGEYLAQNRVVLLDTSECGDYIIAGASGHNAEL